MLYVCVLFNDDTNKGKQQNVAEKSMNFHYAMTAFMLQKSAIARITNYQEKKRQNYKSTGREPIHQMSFTRLGIRFVAILVWSFVFVCSANENPKTP